MRTLAWVAASAVLLTSMAFSAARGLGATDEESAVASLRSLGVQITADKKCPEKLSLNASLAFKNTDEGKVKAFAPLRRLRSLKAVYIGGWGVNDALLGYLTDLPQLECVDLGYTFVGDEGLRCLSKITSLRNLSLTLNTKITDRGIRHLGKLVNLEELVISDCPKISGAGLIAVRRMTKLRHLDLSRTSVTDDGVPALGPHPALESVILRCTMFSDKAMDGLATMVNLRDLDVEETVVTTACANAFRKAHPNVKVDHRRGLFE
jgi:hypothetical protein